MNIRQNLKNTEGITLVALVVTLIVLLILAGVSLSAVFNQDGIFSRANQATTKYGKEKSRETLELALGEVKMMKYEERPDETTYNQKLDEQLNKIGQIGGTDNDEVTVDGFIWKIDRNEPKIIDYIGEDDGIEIRYTITGNDTWTKEAKTITVNVTVKNNKGALDTSSIKVTKNGTDITSSVSIGSGAFTLTTSDTTETIFTISAKNSEGEQSTPRVIKIIPKIDTTPPTLTETNATSSGMKITIKAQATDTQSGLKTINYAVTPDTIKLAEDGTSKATGTLNSGEVLELTATAEGEYTITFTATDNAGNTSASATAKVTTIDGITIAEAKARIKSMDDYKELLGTKVIDYNPPAGGTWRIFYYDEGDDENPNGYFGDGAGTIYLKRDYDTTKTTTLSSYISYNPIDGGVMLRRQCPLWSVGAGGSAINLLHEHCVAWLTDPNVWNDEYKTADAYYAIGAPSREMWTKAYNAYVEEYEPTRGRIGCGILNQYGYGWCYERRRTIRFTLSWIK